MCCLQQVDPDPLTNASLSEDVRVPDDVHEQRLNELKGLGASRKVYLFLHNPDDDAWLRRLATTENVQKEQSAYDSGQTLPDQLTAMREQVQTVEPLLKKKVQEYAASNPGKVLNLPSSRPDSRPWTPSDPLPYHDKSMSLFQDDESALWDSMDYKSRAEIKFPGKVSEQERAVADNLKVDLHSDEGMMKVQQHMLKTSLADPPKRTLFNLLQYECCMVLIEEVTRASVQGSRQPLFMRWAFRAPQDVFDLLIRFLNEAQDNKLADFADHNWRPGTRVVGLQHSPQPAWSAP